MLIIYCFYYQQSPRIYHTTLVCGSVYCLMCCMCSSAFWSTDKFMVYVGQCIVSCVACVPVPSGRRTSSWCIVSRVAYVLVPSGRRTSSWCIVSRVVCFLVPSGRRTSSWCMWVSVLSHVLHVF